MTKNNLYVDIHVLQTIPSSNINRDDTGAPKTAVYGELLDHVCLHKAGKSY